jgi:ABC-type multidrug transport system ATPase subunit
VEGAGGRLEIRGLRKHWRGAPAPVLDGLDLDVGPGETVAIVGANGAGKTTLLRIVAGLLAPDAGTVELCGRTLAADRTGYQRALGLLSAGNTGLYARLKVEHHLDLGTRLALMPRRDRGRAAEWALEAFGLRPLCGRRVDRLSMGQRQRLRLALAFVHRPQLVLLDEPATSLDAEALDTVQRALDELKARGGSALVCTPTGAGAAPACDRTHTLAAGALAA